MTSAAPQRVMPIEEVLTLDPIDRDIFRGPVVPSPIQRTFGGQVAGQALMAAVMTVDPSRSVHSLHGYFLRPGQPQKPTVYTVSRIRDGGSFSTREVHAIQDGETIFAMTASFHVYEEGLEHQEPIPPTPGPDESVTPKSWAYFSNLWSSWDVRRVHRDAVPLDGAVARQRVWIRYSGAMPDVPALHVCGLAYLSDMTLLMSARAPHRHIPVKVASLDHAMWIMRPFRVDEWLLYDQVSPSAQGGRALTQGKLFNQAGSLVACVAQEGGMKLVRDGS
ncbi:acyl-CoA thioesterase [Segniliparus rotundus DSM 44985]|uniref:Acyl-CoA thioesterase n=1 Tax=Segniliparus rotundus (strain ATCC BAA-972 / CDC 1076 / CIP 108378 / DSM 44985 / JCM 13578) TaxID=640132 RepID=D6Z8Q8_SEGRD|nr:acyl-CoA thioesterase [Segniliparus rotundus DSM 44985]